MQKKIEGAATDKRISFDVLRINEPTVPRVVAGNSGRETAQTQLPSGEARESQAMMPKPN